MHGFEQFRDKLKNKIENVQVVWVTLVLHMRYLLLLFFAGTTELLTLLFWMKYKICFTHEASKSV